MMTAINDLNALNAINDPNALNDTNDLNELNALNHLNDLNELNAPNALNELNALNHLNALNAPNEPNAINDLNALNALNALNDPMPLNVSDPIEALTPKSFYLQLAMHKTVSYSDRQPEHMPEINIGIKFADLVAALKKLNVRDREEFLENLLAATSPEYVSSIGDAREDYKKGRVSSHVAVFSEKNKQTK